MKRPQRSKVAKNRLIRITTQGLSVKKDPYHVLIVPVIPVKRRKRLRTQ